ncbi:MAG: Rho termination factor N-terminal domain-containing protein [Saprospiraceae bacterium]|nr:Rho termination factor N-terminal domain-containing protein [Candidatus Vicinibacter affinis]
MYDILQLNDMLVPELKEIAERLGVTNAKKLTKQDLVYKILDQQALVGSKNPFRIRKYLPTKAVHRHRRNPTRYWRMKTTLEIEGGESLNRKVPRK